MGRGVAPGSVAGRGLKREKSGQALTSKEGSARLSSRARIETWTSHAELG